ncbi:peroxiredoxin [Deinococcus psychrotolerans]|uniref:Peroxiredoxin n=1 Tax=Deinococcus psychrotolerans TaxID=2489213 RepID=A0A3G8YDE3_9DEIO|nr:peroxiredoxin [Deinococcus psychrotolerans]AZI42880.1 peroxiredoxin [Deinococcus psychrotolerans]
MTLPDSASHSELQVAPQVGDLAPDFTLPSTSGDSVTLSSYRSHKNVVLVFYPLDFSPVCSMQLPEYSGRQDDFAEADTMVLGLNRDSLHTHKAWAAEYGIEVPLLADMKLEVARSYGVAIEDRAISGRAVFLIDKEGKIRFRFVEEKAGDYTLRPEQVLEKIKAL